MRVTEGVTWVASCTENFDATVAFFRDTLGLQLEKEGTPRVDTQFVRFAKFKMPNDGAFEVLEPGEDARGRYTGPVVALTVDDLEQARAELEEQGVELLTSILDDGTHWRWCYLRAPDGNAYLIQERR